MKRTGPDSIRSWMIVLYCSLISMLLYGVVRLSGIMFVASMEQFHVDRLAASLPYTLCDCLQALTGPVTGFLSLKFGARLVMTLGSLIAAIGIGTCFFAENIETVTVLWGVVYGMGFGLSTLLLPAVITQHFIKRRATAISVVYAGAYVGFSFLPSIADSLIHTYGLSGTYLFLSGFLLHCVPLSMLLRSPDTIQDQVISSPGRSRASSICIVGGYPLCAVKEPRLSVISEICDDIPTSDSRSVNLSVNEEDSCSIISNSVVSQFQNRQTAPNSRSQSLFGRENAGFVMEDLTKLDHIRRYNAEFSKPVTKFKYIADPADYTRAAPRLLNMERIESSSNIFFNNASKNSFPKLPSSNDAENSEKHLKDLFPVFVNPSVKSIATNHESFSRKESLKSSVSQNYMQMNRLANITKQEVTISKGFKIFLEPIFLLVLLGNAVFASSFITFITVVVDFSMDIGISESDGKYVIMFFSIASNIGLLSFGWVTDCGYLSSTNFAALMFFLRTVTLCAIPYSNGFGMFIGVITVQGFVEASLANMFPLAVTEYYIDEIHELAISCTLFLCGPMYLVTPLLIGYFRDGLGSYLYLFLLMAVQSLICGILYLMTPILAKCRCGRDDWILRKES